MQLDVRDAAGIFNVSEKTMHRWIKQGKLPACRVNDEYRFNRAELLEWANDRKVNVSAVMTHESKAGGASPARLDEALKHGGIHYRVVGTDRASVLRAVVDLMQLPAEVEPSFLYQVLLARESLGSTAIGDGIAMPHARQPIVLHTPQSALTLCFLEAPVEFGAPDGQPVHTLFTLVSPTVRAHLELLSKLAFALQDQQLRALLRRKAASEEILDAVACIEASLDSRTSNFRMLRPSTS